jgi:hypothetical protein
VLADVVSWERGGSSIAVVKHAIVNECKPFWW